MPRKKGGSDQIKMSRTRREIAPVNETAPLNEGLFEVKRTQSMPELNFFGMDSFGDWNIISKEEQEETKPVIITTKTLKKKAEKIPVLIPAKAVKSEKVKDTEKKKKTEKAKEAEKSKKKDSITKEELESAKSTIRDLHKELEKEEKAHFSGKAYKNINRNYYGALSASDIKKRAQEALVRKKNAQDITEYEAAHKKGNRYDFTHIDRQTLTEKIKLFKKMPSVPLDMDDDKKFIENLDENYKLCDAAELMKYWLEEANDMGFLPEGIDMAALQERIESFAEVRKYLDAQKELMKNPYYQYMAKDDISYTDKELEILADDSKNQTLKSYFNNVRTLRNLHFIRSKGMKSAKKHAKSQGKKATQILSSKNEKRDIIGKMAEHSLNSTGSQRFLDSNYDARFTPQKFEESLKKFKALKINDIHFASIKDITEHFEENQLIFDQTHDLEHLLLVAIQQNMAPPDDELVELRAKIEAVTVAERMVSSAQENVIANSDEFINKKTYKDFEEGIYNSVKAIYDSMERHEPPKFGCDLNKYLKSVIKDYKRDHKNREGTIRLMYGLTHPVKDDEGDYLPGTISEKELKRRMAGYQKNAVKNDYMRNVETYIGATSPHRIRAIAIAYAKETGRQVCDLTGRTISPYLAGKSAREIIKVIDTLQLGSPEEKEQLWTGIVNEALSINISELDSNDPKVFFKNAAAKGRNSNIGANLAGNAGTATKYIHDKNLLKKADAFYNTICGHTYNSSYSQSVISQKMNAVEFEDWFNTDSAAISSLLDYIDNMTTNDVNLTIDDRDYSMSYESFGLLNKALKRLDFMRQSGMSTINKDRSKKGIRDTASITYYDGIKAGGVVSAVTDNDLKEMIGFYKAYDEKYEKDHYQLMDRIEKELQKENSAYKHKSGVRPWLISNVAVLNKDNKEDETEKSTKLFKGIILDKNKKDAASKQERTEAIESLFSAVMSFDISRFDFKSYKDMISANKEDPSRFEDCRAVARLSMEVVNYIDEYKKLRQDEEVISRLGAAHVEEVAARCDMLMSVSPFFDQKFVDVMSSDEISKSGMSLDDILHLPPKEIDENLRRATDSRDPSRLNFWINIKTITETLSGFDVQIPLTTLEESFRARHNLNGESRAVETMNILKGIESVLQDVPIGTLTVSYLNENEFRSQYSEAFKERDLAVSERESKIFNKRSRLYTKRVQSEKINEKSRNVRDDIASSKAHISLKNRIAAGEKDLDLLSAFMSGDHEEDNLMVEGYADKDSRYDILDSITIELMGMNTDIKIASDEEFARSSDELEQISRKAVAYDKLFKANPGYSKRLMNKTSGSTDSDLKKVNDKLDQMLAISDYYRARKALMTDPYYILHYNEEISTERDTATTDDQRRVADLIKLVSLCTSRLADKDSLTRESADMDRVLDHFETLGRQNAFLTGRPDITQVSPGKVCKNNEEIARYLETANFSASTSKNEIASTNADKPSLDAEKYKTKAAKNYFDAVRRYCQMSVPEYQSKILTPEQAELNEELNRRFTDINGESVRYPMLKDPKTGEFWTFNIDINRIALPTVLSYAGEMSNEEILDIFEGLLITHRADIDMSDEKQRNYARERYLDSAAKIFRMEYEHMKRYEKTYGTIGGDLPFGMFMQSMGAGQQEFIVR
ncbi:MAG: hypothetical protein K6G42_11610, partial [Lachnospiraceae bacterium]|nr:hypothetical protein [Lachnospiraceae bacterium]